MAPAQASRAAAGAIDGRRSAVKDTVKIYSQNSRGLRAAALEEVLATMKKEGVFAWLLQETWRLNTEEHHHEDGYEQEHEHHTMQVPELHHDHGTYYP